jgi:hypothetical protein
VSSHGGRGQRNFFHDNCTPEGGALVTYLSQWPTFRITAGVILTYELAGEWERGHLETAATIVPKKTKALDSENDKVTYSPP